MKPIYDVLRADAPDWARVPSVSLAHQAWLAPCAVAAKAQACHDGERLFVRLEAEE